MPPWHRAQERCVFNLVVWKSIQARLFAPASRKAWCKYTRELSLSTVQKTGLPHQAQTENICSSSPRKRISKCVLPLPPHPVPIQWRKPSPCLPSGFSTITPPQPAGPPFLPHAPKVTRSTWTTANILSIHQPNSHTVTVTLVTAPVDDC